MTSEGLGEMFEGDSADMCVSTSVDGGPSRGYRVRRPGSEDPIGASRNLYFVPGWLLIFHVFRPYVSLPLSSAPSSFHP